MIISFLRGQVVSQCQMDILSESRDSARQVEDALNVIVDFLP